MSTTIITALVGLFCTLVSSVATFLLTKRKYNAEVNEQQLKNVNTSFELYKKMTNEAIKMQNIKIAMQDETIKRLQQENNDLRKQIHNLQMQMTQLLGTICSDTTCQSRKGNFFSAYNNTNAKPE